MGMLDVAPIYDYIDRHLPQHVALLQEYVRQPSVSVDGTGMSECAELVARFYRDLGCQEVELIDGPGYPGVWAYYDAGAPHTLISYNMYDVASVGPEAAWRHPPFGGMVEPSDEFPSILYGRGACVPKGPYGAWLCALKSIIACTGTLPVNIAFLAEGEEILGSPHYGRFIERYRSQLTDAQGCLYLRATQNLKGELPLVLGYKGLLVVEVEASGRAWGRGPRAQPVHSATQAIVDSPVWRLVHALATLTGEDDHRPRIEGLEATFREPAHALPEDDELIANLVRHYEGKSWEEIIPGLAGGAVERFVDDVQGVDVLKRYMFGSTLNIQGIAAGYTGPGTRTFTVPDTARALLDIRMISDLSPDEVVGKIREHLDRHGFPDVEVRAKGGYPWSRTSVSSPLVQSFLRCIALHGGTTIIWPFQGYGGPWSIFRSAFGMPVVFATGIGHGGRVGMPDEYFVLDGGGKVAGLPEIEKFYVDLLYDWAASIQ